MQVHNCESISRVGQVCSRARHDADKCMIETRLMWWEKTQESYFNIAGKWGACMRMLMHSTSCYPVVPCNECRHGMFVLMIFC